MVDQVGSEPFSTAESRQQTRFGSNWSNLPLPVMRTECVNERIGDLSLIEIYRRKTQSHGIEADLDATTQKCMLSIDLH